MFYLLKGSENVPRVILRLLLIRMVIVVVIVEQIEANLLSPQIMGKKLDVHPLMIILLLITFGSFGGLLSMFLAVPAYAILKISHQRPRSRIPTLR